MSTDKRTVSWKATKEMRDQIEAYQERAGYDDRSDALRELVEVGLRESKAPIVYRLKDRVVDWASIMSIAAVMVFIAGATTSIFAMGDALKFSLSLVIVAVAMLAAFELGRVALGINGLGVRMRDVLERDSA